MSAPTEIRQALNQADYRNMTRRELALWAQGARCGHIDGKARCGAYVVGEEFAVEVTIDPAWRNRFERTCFEGGYCDGYRVGASGEALPDSVVSWELP